MGVQAGKGVLGAAVLNSKKTPQPLYVQVKCAKRIRSTWKGEGSQIRGYIRDLSPLSRPNPNQLKLFRVPHLSDYLGMVSELEIAGSPNTSELFKMRRSSGIGQLVHV
jgi:hypothetical protein